MVTYAAPLEDIRFALEEVVGLDKLAELDGLDSLTPDLVNQVLDEAGKFASDVLAPINKSGAYTNCAGRVTPGPSNKHLRESPGMHGRESMSCRPSWMPCRPTQPSGK